MTQTDIVGQYATVNGLKMYYEIHGSGFPLVLIHGGGSDIGVTFGRVLPILAQSHRVIGIDMQAHGRTPDRGVPTSFEQDADDVAALLKSLGINQADIFGFSNGGNTAMQVAIRHPHLVHKIVIASSFYKRDGFDAWFWDFMPNASLDNMPKPLQEAFLAINNDPAALEIMHNRDRDRMLAFEDWSDDTIRSITMPALVIAGDNDVIRPEHTLQLYRTLPNAQLCILPAGHGDYIGEIEEIRENENYPAVTIIEEFLTKAKA
ncbi:alpha/beta fold hydrolase [Mucilaginibacter angelicae]|uniref:Alpha/beta fold hydrolase n=1 Tax=Mucilaginibacter angelicae TaxID=869718 RepID=A0ABV6L4Q1_9SPHI